MLLVRKDLVRQWIHVLHQYLALLDDWHLFSTVKWSLSLKCFFSVLTRNGEVFSVDASVFSLLHSSHLEPGFFLSVM